MIKILENKYGKIKMSDGKIVDVSVGIPMEFRSVLRNRFDHRMAKRKRDPVRTYYVIAEPCPLCLTYKECKGCPLSFDGIKRFCIDIINFLAFGYTPKGVCFDILIEKIRWGETDNKDARRQLLKILNMADRYIKWN